MYVHCSGGKRGMYIHGDEKYIVCGAGKCAQGMAKYTSQFFDILGYYDSNDSLWGKTFCGKSIFDKAQVIELCQKYQDNLYFIVSPIHAEVAAEIADVIKTEFRGRIIDKDVLQNDMMRRKHEENANGAGEYHVNFARQSMQWIEELVSEVRYWVNRVAKRNSTYHGEYLDNINNLKVKPAKGYHGENIFHYLKEGSVLMDVGCGAVSRYGSLLPDGGIVNLIAVDSLAHAYKKINDYYAPENKKTVMFGMFEFMAVFFRKNFADVILIENALDHCVDPLKSVVECLQVLKPSGLLRLYHHRAEAIWEGCLGLHKWNIDYNDNKEFIIWNENHYININKFFGDDVEIRVYAEGGEQRSSQYLTVELVKKETYDYLNYINLAEENVQLGKCINSMMAYMAENCYHYL